MLTIAEEKNYASINLGGSYGNCTACYCSWCTCHGPGFYGVLFPAKQRVSKPEGNFCGGCVTGGPNSL